jgi:MinD-like ATPase involved in chromosome partitioning or flagellar assembly
MQTITFYSYKGGVGRSLVLANVAIYLAKFGQKVFALDFDLESPGLHYKFIPKRNERKEKIKQGAVDLIHRFAATDYGNNVLPESLLDYTVEIERREDSGGSITLLPAGNVPSKEYWQKLAGINWKELFYAEADESLPLGIPFFLELKERIRNEFSPDFLLIDSRTGITEIGGIATTILPDNVICLMVNNEENLEGARAVLRAIRKAPRLSNQTTVEILPILTRIPEMEKSEEEEKITAEIKAFLNEDAEDLADTLHVEEVLVLHSEPELQIKETIRIEGDKTLDESLLLRDYLSLISKLIPREIIETQLEPLIRNAQLRAYKDPQTAKIELERLADYCPHHDTFHALLEFYKLRNLSGVLSIKAAEKFWKSTGICDDALQINAIIEQFDIPTQCSSAFLEKIFNLILKKDSTYILSFFNKSKFLTTININPNDFQIWFNIINIIEDIKIKKMVLDKSLERIIRGRGGGLDKYVAQIGKICRDLGMKSEFDQFISTQADPKQRAQFLHDFKNLMK